LVVLPFGELNENLTASVEVCSLWLSF